MFGRHAIGGLAAVVLFSLSKVQMPAADSKQTDTHKGSYLDTMPHSLSSEGTLEEDSVLTDAPPAIPTASDVEDKGDSGSSPGAAEDHVKAAVKLEDMFDDEEDEEFPSSGVTDGVAQSSPPLTGPP